MARTPLEVTVAVLRPFRATFVLGQQTQILRHNS
jgi:hypothetical protein